VPPVRGRVPAVDNSRAAAAGACIGSVTDDWVPPGHRLGAPLGDGLWSATGPEGRVLLRRVEAAAAATATVRLPVVRQLPYVVPPRAVLPGAVVLDGEASTSLAALLAGRGRLDPGEVVTVGVPVARALAAAAEAGLVHGAVAAGQVLVEPAGVPLLAGLEVGPGHGDPSEDVRALAALCVGLLLGTGPGEDVEVALREVGTPPPLVAVLLAGCGPPSSRPCAAGLAERLRRSGPAEPLRGLRALVPVRPPRTPREPAAGPGEVAADPREPAAGPGDVAADPREPAAGPRKVVAGSVPVRTRGRLAVDDVPGASPPVGPPPTAARAPVVRHRNGRRRPPAHAAPRRVRPRLRQAVGAVAVAVAALTLAGGLGAAVAAGWETGRESAPGPVRSAQGPPPAGAARAGDGAQGRAGVVTGAVDEAPGPAGRGAGAAPGPAVAASEWGAVLDRLDGVRAQAFAAADPARLSEVYAPGSPGLAADAALLDRLRAAGQTAHRLRRTVTAVAPQRVTEGEVVLRVTDVLGEHEVRDAGGRVVHRVAARGTREFDVRLVRAPARGWRISSVTALG
jgi:eukaryotic-like serine/threonine-protein kinase